MVSLRVIFKFKSLRFNGPVWRVKEATQELVPARIRRPGLSRGWHSYHRFGTNKWTGALAKQGRFVKTRRTSERLVADNNPTPSHRRIEGRQRGVLEIVAMRWTELRRRHRASANTRKHRAAPRADIIISRSPSSFDQPPNFSITDVRNETGQRAKREYATLCAASLAQWRNEPAAAR